eukprot:1145480-Pelagomonas_calceolata.AAC.1
MHAYKHLNGTARQMTGCMLTNTLVAQLGRQTTVSSAPHHPNVLDRLDSKPLEWSERNRIRAESVAWQDKVPQMFFRGTRYCPTVPLRVR